MMHPRPDLGERLTDALRSYAHTIGPKNVLQPPIEEHGAPRPLRRQPSVALAAAAAVGLAIAIPYGLLHDGAPAPAPAATTTSIGQDPTPLPRVNRPADGQFYIRNVIGGGGMVAEIFRTEDNERSIQKLPGDTNWSVTAVPDGRTFYVSRYKNDADCESELAKVVLRDDGKIRSLTPVPKSQAAGQHYSDLALSPDGRTIALTSRALKWNGKHCLPSLKDYELATLDLASGERRSWRQGTKSDGWAQSELAWSLDGRYLVFRWPLEVLSEGHVALRMLDPSAPEGDLEAASKPVPRDETFYVGKRTRLEAITSGSNLGHPYPGWLTAYQRLGGARILAYAQESVADQRKRRQSPAQSPEPSPTPDSAQTVTSDDSHRGVLVEISLTTGKIREVPR